MFKRLLLATALIATASSANASLMMMVGSTTITDNGAGDSDSRIGVISYQGTVGNFNANLSTQTGSFSANPVFFDLGNSLLSSNGAGSLVIKLTSTDLTTPAAASQFLTQFSGNFSTGASASAQSYLDTSNVAFGMGTLLSNLSSTTSPFGLSNAQTAGGLTPFSLTEVVTVNAMNASSFSLDTSISTAPPSPVPEPATFGLLGAGLAAVGLVRRNRGRNAA